MRVQKGASESEPGIYFNRTTNEIRRVMDRNGSLGPQWEYVTGDTDLGLLAVRELLEALGLSEDSTRAYWYMPSAVVGREG